MGLVSRGVCPRRSRCSTVKIARTKRRLELQVSIEKLTDALPAAVKVADPGSSALSVYLAALFGVTLAADTIAQWLSLVPVLALELGAALAMVLVEAIDKSDEGTSIGKADNEISDGSTPIAPADTAKAGQILRHVQSKKPVSSAIIKSDKTAVIEPSTPAKPGRKAAGGQVAKVRGKVAKRIVASLEANGGRLSRSQRGLAKHLKCRRSTLQNAIGALIAAGTIAATSSAQGTALRLL
jgi:hypothetical protein